MAQKLDFDGFSFAFDKEVLLKSKKALSTKNFTDFDGFTISGTEPSGTQRKIIFKVDDAFYKLTVDSNGKATATKLFDIEPTFKEILSKGNTVAELSKAINVNVWLNKDIYPYIALFASKTAVNEGQYPSISLTCKLRSSTELYTFEETSEDVNLTNDGTSADIIQVDATLNTQGNGKVSIQGAIKTNGKYSSWMALDQMKNKSGSAVKFKVTYSVSDVSEKSKDLAAIDNIAIQYMSNNAKVTGSKAELVTKTVQYSNNLKYCQLVVNHLPLKDATMDAYVSFRAKPKTREMINIGTGTGVTQSIKVSDNAINHNSLHVYVDGKEIKNFDFNTTDGEITGVFSKNKAISASYDYDFQNEVWNKMEKVVTEMESEDMATTKYQYLTPNEEQSISSLKIVLNRPTKNGEVEDLGKANGRTQAYKLKHFAEPNSIKVTADGASVPSKNYSFNQDTNLLSVAATSGKKLSVTYNWVAETGEITGLFAGWSVA